MTWLPRLTSSSSRCAGYGFESVRIGRGKASAIPIAHDVLHIELIAFHTYDFTFCDCVQGEIRRRLSRADERAIRIEHIPRPGLFRGSGEIRVDWLPVLIDVSDPDYSGC